jgi:CheY-like chemotaxis protein
MDISDKTLKILLVEDDEVDILHIKYGFRECKILNTLEIVSDGATALEILVNAEKNHLNNKIPNIIFLDINLPRMNGFTFLEKLQAYPTLKLIPVIIISTSISDADKKKAADFAVVGYFSKPLQFEEFITLYKNM